MGVIVLMVKSLTTLSPSNFERTKRSTPLQGVTVPNSSISGCSRSITMYGVIVNKSKNCVEKAKYLKKI